MSDNKYLFGRNSLLEVAIVDQSTDPSGVTFKPLGAVTTKSFSLDGNSVEVNDSASSSGFTQNQISTSSLTMSISGNRVRDPASFPNATLIAELMVHRFEAVKQNLSGDPVILVRLTQPDLILTAYMLINSISDEMPDADLSTFSMELALAISPTYPPTLTANPAPQLLDGYKKARLIAGFLFI